MAQVFEDPRVNATQMFQPVEVYRIPGFQALDLPVSINGEKALLQNMPPRLEEHTDEVLRRIGYREGEVADLRGAGVVV